MIIRDWVFVIGGMNIGSAVTGIIDGDGSLNLIWLALGVGIVAINAYLIPHKNANTLS